MALITIDIRTESPLYVKVWDRSIERHIAGPVLLNGSMSVERISPNSLYGVYGEINFDVSEDDAHYRRLPTVTVETGGEYLVE